MSTEIEIVDNSGRVREEMEAAVLRALEECGLVAEGYAKRLSPVDTGNLRNSITHTVVNDGSETAVYVGTDVEYGVYQELGTGQYVAGGRTTPWVYKDERGNWHTTRGNKAKPFIKPSIADHAQQYRRIIESELREGGE